MGQRPKENNNFREQLCWSQGYGEAFPSELRAEGRVWGVALGGVFGAVGPTAAVGSGRERSAADFGSLERIAPELRGVVPIVQKCRAEWVQKSNSWILTREGVRIWKILVGENGATWPIACLRIWANGSHLGLDSGLKGAKVRG